MNSKRVTINYSGVVATESRAEPGKSTYGPFGTLSNKMSDSMSILGGRSECTRNLAVLALRLLSPDRSCSALEGQCILL